MTTRETARRTHRESSRATRCTTCSAVKFLHDEANETHKQQIQILRKRNLLNSNSLKRFLFLFVSFFQTFLRYRAIGWLPWRHFPTSSCQQARIYLRVSRPWGSYKGCIHKIRGHSLQWYKQLQPHPQLEKRSIIHEKVQESSILPLYFSASSTMHSISSQERRPLSLVILIQFKFSVVLSEVETFKIPLASISRVTGIWGEI